MVNEHPSKQSIDQEEGYESLTESLIFQKISKHLLPEKLLKEYDIYSKDKEFLSVLIDGLKNLLNNPFLSELLSKKSLISLFLSKKNIEQEEGLDITQKINKEINNDGDGVEYKMATYYDMFKKNPVETIAEVLSEIFILSQQINKKALERIEPKIESFGYYEEDQKPIIFKAAIISEVVQAMINRYNDPDLKKYLNSFYKKQLEEFPMGMILRQQREVF